MDAKTHRSVSEHYKALFLAEPNVDKRARWRKLQMKHVVLAAAGERESRGVTALTDRERAVWKPPCLKGCEVNCGRCA